MVNSGSWGIDRLVAELGMLTDMLMDVEGKEWTGKEVGDGLLSGMKWQRWYLSEVLKEENDQKIFTKICKNDSLPYFNGQYQEKLGKQI